MDILTALTTLAQAGAVVILVVENGLILVGAFRKWWVPGWIFDREVKRGDDATAEAKANTDLLKTLTTSIDGALKGLTTSIDTIIEFALRKVSGKPDA